MKPVKHFSFICLLSYWRVMGSASQRRLMQESELCCKQSPLNSGVNAKNVTLISQRWLFNLS
jgi:hypothetical protein